MTLYDVIHGVAFAQAFNFYLQQRRLIPPGTLGDEFNARIAFAQDLEAAQEYAHTQADLAWAFYQRCPVTPVYGWEAAANNNQREPMRRPTTLPPPPPPVRSTPLRQQTSLAQTVRNPHLKQTVRMPSVTVDSRQWQSDDSPSTHPYSR